MVWSVNQANPFPKQQSSSSYPPRATLSTSNNFSTIHCRWHKRDSHLLHRGFRGSARMPSTMVSREGATAFAAGLGTAYPCPIAVDMEPLSASQFKVLHQNTCYYHQDLHYRRLQLTSRPTFNAHRHATLHVKALRLNRF